MLALYWWLFLIASDAPYLLHKYFKTNKDKPEKNYYRKITEENKWLKKLSPIKMYQTTIRNQIITIKIFCGWKKFLY